MNIGIITNKKSPYRTLQVKEICKNESYRISVYYTDKLVISRNWEIEEAGFNEELLSSYKNILSTIKKLINIVKSNEIIIIGGYDKPQYIILSILSQYFKKPYVILFDGISPHKIKIKEDFFKYFLKKKTIMGADAIFGNGIVSKEYFSTKFRYEKSKIYNQYLTVDVDKIKSYESKRNLLKQELRTLYKITNQKVIIYSGRLIKRKNLDVLIKAISSLHNREEYTLLVLGDGEEREPLLKLANELNVHIIVTGFIKKQEELFKHYYIGDLLVLPSSNEPWGLVVNEAMAASLPVIVTQECGCSLDLVKDQYNGFVVPVLDANKLGEKIKEVFKNTSEMGKCSNQLIERWTFASSRMKFEEMITYIYTKVV